jgi:hypothetical protein
MFLPANTLTKQKERPLIGLVTQSPLTLGAGVPIPRTSRSTSEQDFVTALETVRMRSNQHQWESGSEAHSKCILTQRIDCRDLAARLEF